MLTKVLSVASLGLKTIPVEVEVNINKKGFPGFQIIGLGNKAVEEAKERVRTALVNSGISFPTAKIVVNLAPADVPKEGTCYDLPIALGILGALGLVKLPKKKVLFYGELSLDGSLRHTKGVFLLAITAREKGIKEVFIPYLSANEAAVVEGIKVFPVKTLRQLTAHFNGIEKISPWRFKKMEEEEVISDFDFAEIIGQEQAKRALEIAAAGGHNVFMQGPPGAGKTMLARALPGILPPLSEEESLEVTKIYSLSGNIPPGGSLIRTRPFRAVHHTVSRVGLIGGGSQPHPGEISLAHSGVLFLDELPEFSRSVLEALRQPLEDGEVNIARAAGSVKFPARFMLVAAANPCPCGFLGDPYHQCRCSPRQIARYQNKLSGPLMDRIDIHLTLSPVKTKNLMGHQKAKGESSATIRRRVVKARQVQQKRFADLKIHSNAEMGNKEVKKFCPLTPEADALLHQAVANFHLSARSFFRLLKVARTIADLEGEEKITASCLAEALQYRFRFSSS